MDVLEESNVYFAPAWITNSDIPVRCLVTAHTQLPRLSCSLFLKEINIRRASTRISSARNEQQNREEHTTISIVESVHMSSDI